MYPAVISLIEIALHNWAHYDAWCLSRGFDPLELPSRRFINSIWAWITEGMEDETKNNLLDALQQTAYQQPRRQPTAATTTVDEQSEIKKVVEFDPKNKWKAPKGWTPANWDEEASYNNAMSFIDSKNSGFTR